MSYPLDLTGVNPNNLVQNELHSVNEGHFRDYYFIVPNFSPFYTDNFSATITVNSVTTTLVEDVDFSFTLPYVTGTRVTGKAMYGAITLHNLNLNGILSITYQTIGGDQVADRLSILTKLSDIVYNPRTTVWDSLIPDTVPNAFPPTPHYNSYTDFYGQEELVTALGEIRDAIIQNSSLTQAEIQNFLNTLGINITNYVQKTGDTMTGYLTLSNDPTDNLHATTKQYVDFNTSNKVNKAGDTMTGFLTLHSDPVQNLHAATKGYIDDKINEILSYIQSVVINSKSGNENAVVDTTALEQSINQLIENKTNEIMAYVQSLVINSLNNTNLNTQDNSSLQQSLFAYVDDRFNELLAYVNNR